MSSNIGRDAQLASSFFDVEILQLFSVQLNRVFSSLGRPSLARAVRPELDALLNASVVYFSLLRSSRTPGQALQDLGYAPFSRLQKLWTFVLLVGGPYVYARFPHPLFARAEQWWKVLSFVNFSFFFFSGRYPQLWERLAGATLSSRPPPRGRAVAFDFMNRQLVWSVLTDSLLFFTPLILGNMRTLEKLFRQTVANPLIPETQCGICGADPKHNPHGGTACTHSCCYYCIATKLEQDGHDFPCPNCGLLITKENLTKKV